MLLIVKIKEVDKTLLNKLPSENREIIQSQNFTGTTDEICIAVDLNRANISLFKEVVDEFLHDGKYIRWFKGAEEIEFLENQVKQTLEEVLKQKTQKFTALIEREGNGYVSLCPELDIASQGDTVEEAKRNLIEALELFFETAEPSEIKNRSRSEVFITSLEVVVG